MGASRLTRRRPEGLNRHFNAGALTLALAAAVVARVHTVLDSRRVDLPSEAPPDSAFQTPVALAAPALAAAPPDRRWRRAMTKAVAATCLMVFVAAVVVAPAVATDDATNDLLALTPPTAGRPTAQPSSAVLSPSGTANVDLSGSPTNLDGSAVAPAAPNLDLSASPTAAPSLVGVPTRVDIPSIGVHASIVPLGLGTNGVIQVPDNFVQAGWYSGGPRPGDSGPAVILGHVDSFRGPAVFFELKDLQPGATITVTSSTGTEAFTVDTVEKYPKTEFPTQEVYGPVTDRALRLVTCGGKFDETHHSYLSNVIVFATAAS
jgi:sortase (surface protein transpeptidase)